MCSVKKFSSEFIHYLSKVKIKIFPCEKNHRKIALVHVYMQDTDESFQSQYITVRSLTNTRCVSNKQRYAIGETQRNNIKFHEVL